MKEAYPCVTSQLVFFLFRLAPFRRAVFIAINTCETIMTRSTEDGNYILSLILVFNIKIRIFNIFMCISIFCDFFSILNF